MSEATFHCPDCAAEAKKLNANARKVHMARCAFDCGHFLDTHAHIYDQQNNDIPFRLFRWQFETLADFAAHKKIVIVKTRGIGLSWLTAGYILWASAVCGKSVVVASRTEAMAMDLMDRARYIMRSVQGEFHIQLTKESATRIAFDTRGVMMSETASEHMGSGYHPSIYILDEWAKLPDDAAITASVMPAVGDGGQFIGFSSPLGLGNQFQLFYDGAVSGSNGFHYKKLHWQTLGEHDPRWAALYDQAWYERQCKLLNNEPAMIAQELDCDFVQSGSPVFLKSDLDVIFGVKNGLIFNKSRRAGRDERVLVSIDPSSGEARGLADNTSIDVLDAAGDQIWHEAWQKPPTEAQRRLYELLSWFKHPVIVLERNGLGALYAGLLKGGQWSLYEVSISKGKDVREVPPDQSVGRPGALATNVKYWWDVSKAALVYPLQNDVASRSFRCYAEGTYKELLVFARIGVDMFGAPQGSHDDHVMSLALGRWAFRKGWIGRPLALARGLYPGAKKRMFDLARGD